MKFFYVLLIVLSYYDLTTCRPVSHPLLQLINGGPVNDVVTCPQGEQCPDRNTCCLSPDGNYDCCPILNAKCCPDRRHCCPNGYHCSSSGGECHKDVPSVDTIESTGMNRKSIFNVICTNEWQCPNNHTCCPKPNGDWACCSLYNAVCCSDGKHCCDSESTCTADGQCEKKTSTTRLVSKESVKVPSVKNIACDATKQCIDGSTCCHGLDGYECCPLPNAVCCKDHKHCCPANFVCNLKTGGCESPPMVKKMIDIAKISTVDNVFCNNKNYQCRAGDTCCQEHDGSYGCCPVKDATCCSNGCCPAGYTCKSDGNTCVKKSSVFLIPMSEKPATTNGLISKVKNVICADGGQCPTNNTCCPKPNSDSDKYGCCPQPNAVCCSDGKHCCPNGYTCNLGDGTCQKDLSVIPMTKKVKTIQKGKTSIISKVKNIICANGVECPTNETCCPIPNGQYGCCPQPNAVCCSDGKHCCPNGYTCNLGDGTCKRDLSVIPMMKKVKTIQKGKNSIISKVKNVICANGVECPTNETCCPIPNGQYGCCPQPNAVCCSDGKHCCPNGYTCNVGDGTCKRDLSVIPMTKKVKTIQKSTILTRVVNKFCPDGINECPNTATCCPIDRVRFGCCPLSDAVCCGDGQHCCPSQYRCDISTGSCVLRVDLKLIPYHHSARNVL